MSSDAALLGLPGWCSPRSSRCRRWRPPCRRRAMREASEVAGALARCALAVRKSAARVCRSMRRCARVRSACSAPEFSLVAARAGTAARHVRNCWRTPRSGSRCASSGAWPSNARCSRAPRRAGGAARWRRSIPPLVLLALHAGGIRVPLAALLFVVALEASAAGCCGAWRAWKSECRAASRSSFSLPSCSA